MEKIKSTKIGFRFRLDLVGLLGQNHRTSRTNSRILYKQSDQRQPEYGRKTVDLIFSTTLMDKYPDLSDIFLHTDRKDRIVIRSGNFKESLIRRTAGLV